MLLDLSDLEVFLTRALDRTGFRVFDECTLTFAVRLVASIGQLGVQILVTRLVNRQSVCIEFGHHRIALLANRGLGRAQK